MNNTLLDTIDRSLVLNAPIERVYAALTEPDKLISWFPDGIQGGLAPGDRPVLDFGQYGKVTIVVVDAKPSTYFAYKWIPGSAIVPGSFDGDILTKPHTLVEFHLEPIPEGTRLRLVESGFASLPSEFYEASIADNQEGWTFMLDRLAKFVQS